MTNIKLYNPAQGQAFQGDIAIVPVPKGWTLDRSQEIPATEGRLILQEGEVSGHHHAIRFPEVTRFRDDGIARDMSAKTASAALAKAIDAAVTAGTAKLYRDDVLLRRMASNEGPLTRTDLCIGFLDVEDDCAPITHEEHDGIKLPEGLYYCGRQIESAGAEDRIVAD